MGRSSHKGEGWGARWLRALAAFAMGATMVSLLHKCLEREFLYQQSSSRYVVGNSDSPIPKERSACSDEQEITRAALSLASNESATITGQALNVCGGLLMS